MCEYEIPDFKEWMGKKDCDLRAEWKILDKTTGKFHYRCKGHLYEDVLIPGHTLVFCPARSYAKKDGLGLTLGEAVAQRVCRICGAPNHPIERPDGTMNTFYMGHGFEYAHEDCLGEEGIKELHKVLSIRGPFRGD
jgi:hypothetical protein